jgi:2-desacetyl-2-hydroxyethyl bacteriochlorophyllide A dehydrogenase
VKAVVLTEDEGVTIADVDEPELVEPGDAVVRVTTTAICGSDLHLLHGKIPGMLPGGVLGHEFTGVVEQLGDEVRGLAVGDRVVGSFLVPCGACGRCDRLDYNHCEHLRIIGYGMILGDLPGAQAERVRVPNADLALQVIPEELTEEQALFAGDILSTALYGVRLGGVGARDGQLVVVQGCGPVGMLTVEIALASGAEQVAAVDVAADRLRVAERLGAVPVDVSGRSAGPALERATGRLADVVIDTAGGPPTVLAQTFDLVATGGTIAVIGVYSDFEMTIPLNILFVNSVTLRFGGTCPVPALWHDAVELVRSGKIDPTAIITHRLPLEEAVRGYELFQSREALKVVLQVAGG